jgi:glycosyltransferase involved in cell wall biosynthesis
LEKLAIVIPAFKAKYLHLALESLANQSCQDFHVYIGDDHSPENLLEVIDGFRERLKLTYHRFSNNIGAKNIVEQWNRCVALTKGEEWVWVFSDDDIADPECVDAFYKMLYSREGQAFDVYRFNTNMIDSNGELIVKGVESPVYEDTFTMAYELLMGRRANSLPDHIFFKEKFDKNGGFIFTNFAQGADWATSIYFSGEKGMCSIPGPRVNWRLSDSNISGNASKNIAPKIKGHLQFLTWVKHYFHFLKKGHVEDFRKILDACDHNLDSVIAKHYKRVSLANFFDIFRYYQLYREWQATTTITRLLKFYKKFYVDLFISKISGKVKSVFSAGG